MDDILKLSVEEQETFEDFFEWLNDWLIRPWLQGLNTEGSGVLLNLKADRTRSVTFTPQLVISHLNLWS